MDRVRSAYTRASERQGSPVPGVRVEMLNGHLSECDSCYFLHSGHHLAIHLQIDET